jgi:uncharacterized protein with GYD domain
MHEQEVEMPTYISLLRFTQKGVESIKEGPKRLDAAKERFRKAGGELKAFYLVTGQYDAVAISEAPDDATVAKLALGNASMGFIRTETLRAFTEGRVPEYRRVAFVEPDPDGRSLASCESRPVQGAGERLLSDSVGWEHGSQPERSDRRLTCATIGPTIPAWTAAASC